MDQNLPDYKREFLNELDEIRQQQMNEHHLLHHNQQAGEQGQSKELAFKVTNTNDIWKTTKYSNPDFRSNLQTSFYTKEHNMMQHDINRLLNPEVIQKTNNMRATQISEYSNAKYNNTVFINPKFSSC